VKVKVKVKLKVKVKAVSTLTMECPVHRHPLCLRNRKLVNRRFFNVWNKAILGLIALQTCLLVSNEIRFDRRGSCGLIVAAAKTEAKPVYGNVRREQVNWNEIGPESQIEPSVITVIDRPNIGYYAQRAAFGNPMLEMVQANLVAPPNAEAEYLCTYPSSLTETLQNTLNSLSLSNATTINANASMEFFNVNLSQHTGSTMQSIGIVGANTSASTNSSATLTSLTNSGMFYSDWPLALLVRGEQCSAETKARVFRTLQQQLLPFFDLRYLLISGLKSTDTGLRTFQLDFPSNTSQQDIHDLLSVGVLYVPYGNAASLQQRMIGRAFSRRTDYRFLSPDNYRWFFPIRIVNESDAAEYFDPQAGAAGTEGRNDAPNFFWFRFVLFSLLIISPFCRAAFLWYSGGGRIRFRHNERGWLVGLLYIA
jgi:hypothetical protein